MILLLWTAFHYRQANAGPANRPGPTRPRGFQPRGARERVLASKVESARRPGVPQGLTVIIAGFLPILAIVSMFPAVPAMIQHFGADPNASWKVPAMVSAPG